jgi:hypothetical protein
MYKFFKSFKKLPPEPLSGIDLTTPYSAGGDNTAKPRHQGNLMPFFTFPAIFYFSHHFTLFPAIFNFIRHVLLFPAIFNFSAI